MWAVLLSSCEKYLSEEPKKQVTIQNAEQLDALMNNVNRYETNYAAGYATDDTEIPKDIFAANTTRFTLAYMFYYVLDPEAMATAATDALWNAEYTKILQANLVLFNLDKITGTEQEKNILKADALFIRGYSNWLLVNHYAMPWKPGVNDDAQGIPLKKSIDYAESLERATLKQTYDAILEDITTAASLTPNDDVQDRLRWRVSRKAISAFLSRYYLFLGDYDKTIQYADEALGSSTAKLYDYKTIIAGNSASFTNPVATLTYSELNDWAASKFLFWSEFYYTRYSYIATQWYVPSAGLRSLYDQGNDLRFKWFFIPNGGRRMSVVDANSWRYTVFNDGRYLPSGPTIAEVLLNKAEAMARTDKWSTALTPVNTLREKRMTTPDPLAASSQDDAIAKVLQERRRELPFAYRFLDIRRFSANNYPADDVTVTRDFWQVNQGGVDVTTPRTYTLEPGSPRYALPITTVEINNSQGALKQNPY